MAHGMNDRFGERKPRPGGLRVRRPMLSPELERSVLAGVISGMIQPSMVSPEELSPDGRAVLRAVISLLDRGVTLPVPADAVALLVVESSGASRAAVEAYLDSVYLHLSSAPGAEDALRKVRARHALLTVINEANEQLQAEKFEPSRFESLLAEIASPESDLVPLDRLLETQHEPPPRLPVPSLPRLSSRLDGGLSGITIVAGEPGTGKTCLVWQISLDAASNGLDVLYYNLDDSVSTLLHRTRVIFEGRPDEAVSLAARSVYIRDDISGIGQDLAKIRTPALVVIDSLQALPAPAEFRKAGLDAWILRIKTLRKRGVYFLLTSEIPRSLYGAGPSLMAPKETGSAEYAADMVWQLIPSRIAGHETAVEVHVTKNRHGPLKGLATTLVRERRWLWREA